MKGVAFLTMSVAIVLVLSACQTVPRHLVREEVVIINYEPILLDIPPLDGPQPPDPPYTPITRPSVKDPIDRNPDKSKDGGNSYGKRDPPQGGNHRGGGEINTVPPVRTPDRKHKGQQ